MKWSKTEAFKQWLLILRQIKLHCKTLYSVKNCMGETPAVKKL